MSWTSEQLIQRLRDLEEAHHALKLKVDSLTPCQRFKKPTIMELWQYANSINFVEFDPDKFIAHYDSNGWMVGKTHMKDWKGAVRTWHWGEKERQRKAGIK